MLHKPLAFFVFFDCGDVCFPSQTDVIFFPCILWFSHEWVQMELMAIGRSILVWFMSYDCLASSQETKQCISL